MDEETLGCLIAIPLIILIHCGIAYALQYVVSWLGYDMPFSIAIMIIFLLSWLKPSRKSD